MREPDPADPIRPMLAADGAMPSGAAWAFEFVWDGLRALIYLRGDRAQVVSASGRLVTSSYPELHGLRRLTNAHGSLVLDGKIVALDQRERPSVVALRRRMNNRNPSEQLRERVPVRFFASDVLFADGRYTTELPFRVRRELLTELDLTGLPADLSPWFVDTDGQTVLRAAEQHGLPGVIAKRLDSRYQPGRRTRAWVQTVPRRTQAVLVGGWLPRADCAPGSHADHGGHGGHGGDPRGHGGHGGHGGEPRRHGGHGGEPRGPGGHGGEPREPAALLVGVTDAAGSLRYLGKVSAGLDRRSRAELAESVAALAHSDCPFVDAPATAMGSVRWLTPRLVGEVSYRRREADGRLQHASWVRLLADAHPATVREPAMVTPQTGRRPTGPARSGIGSLDGARRASASVGGELAALDDAVRLAQAEVRALRAQISPHFLYNALTTIAAYVRTDPDRARGLLHDFAEYTRYSFRAGARSSTLGAELANSDRYLALEGARFGERLRVRRDVAPELLEVAVPFLSVQSLVENAVRHGIEGTPRGGTLRIAAQPVGAAHCLLTIADDGLGMDPTRLSETVTDVRERLAAGPGEAAELDAVSTPESGTTVTVRLPRQPGAPGCGLPH